MSGPISSVDTLLDPTDYILSMKWQRRAACKGKDAEMWFPTRQTSAEAKKICNRCPVKTECLEYSLITEQEWGLWGGVSQRQRKTILRRRQLAPSTT